MAAVPQNVQTFVQDLREAREYRRIPLDQVARDTRIALTYLKALEEGRWDLIPAPYLRGYLTTYAEAVGMVRDKVLKRFDELGYHAPAEAGESSRGLPFAPVDETPDAGTGEKVLVPTLWQVMPKGLKTLLLSLLLLLPLLLVWLVVGLAGGKGEAEPAAFEQTLERSLDEQERQHQILEGFAPFALQVGLQRPAALKVFSQDSLFFRGSLRSDSTLNFQSRSEVVVETERIQELQIWRDGEQLSLPADSGRADVHVSRQGVRVILRKL